MLRKIIPLLACVILACTDSGQPRNLLPPTRMIPLLADMHLAQARVSDAGIPPRQQKQKMADYCRAICQKHKTTVEIFTQSWHWYSLHPADYEKVQEKVMQLLNEQAIRK